MLNLLHQERSLTSARGYVNYILNHRGIQLPPVPETCLITYSDAFLEQAKRRYDHRVIDIGSRKPTEIYFFRSDNGENFSIVSPQYGDAMAVTTLEELIALGEIATELQGRQGFKNFLSMGTAGHPTKSNPELNVGDVLLVNSALSYEGSSVHYAERGHVPRVDERVLTILRDILEQKGIPFKEGLVATTSAIYRETPSFISQVLESGTLGLDMETSALLTVADFYKRRFGTLLYISDIVKVGGSNGEWNVEFLSGDVSDTENKLFDAAIELVNRLKETVPR